MTATTLPQTAGSTAPARRRRSPQLGGYVTMIFATLVLGAPLLWMALASLKAPDELYQVPLQWLPAQPDLDNYAQAAGAIHSSGAPSTRVAKIMVT